MLRIHQVTSATQAKSYYAVADYYSEGLEVAGRWGGKLAASLGLEGVVTKEAFEHLCDNERPDGTPLTPRTKDQRRVGYDFVFSAPKGFSLAEALAPLDLREAMLAAFDEAVRETMTEHVEPDIQTRIRLEGDDRDRNTGSMLWAEFDHSTARPVDGSVPDPHRHRHVLCFNATYDPVEGRVKAGQFAGLKRDGEYYAAIFYSKLAGKLEALGVPIERRGGKEWGIAGISPELEQVYSKRTVEVEEEHAERKANDPTYRLEDKHELGAKTRSGKQKELTQTELRREWVGQLDDAGIAALRAVYTGTIPLSQEVTPAQAVGFAIAHLSEGLSVFPERELVRVALLHGLGHVSPEQVRAELPRHGVILGEFDGRLMATTRALQAEEDRMVQFARPGRGVKPLGVPEGLERGFLNDGQWEAVTGLLKSPNRVSLIEGPAGAGKSSLLQKFDEGVRLAGGKVTFLATTSTAVEVLKKDGFTAAETLARFLIDSRLQEHARGGLLVVDEISMAGHRDAARLCHLAEKLDLTLILSGDQMQHGSVPRGAFPSLLKTHAGVVPFRLTEIMRQEDAAYRDAAKLLADGESLQGFDALDAQGWVKEIAGDQERYQALAAEYLEAVTKKQGVIVVSPTHAEAAKITDAIRNELRQAGKLGEKERPFTRLVAVNASEAERGLATTYRQGDILQYTQNAKGVTKGERLTVSDPAAVPLEHAGKFSLYRPEAIALAVGDKIRFTSTVSTMDSKHKLRNGMTRTVKGFDRQGNIRLDNDWMVAKDAGHFRSAFVETSYGAQGQTHQKVILGMGSASVGAISRETLYVSATRGKASVSLYTDDKAAVRSAVARSSQKLAALDLVEKEAPAAKPEPWRHHRAHARRQGFFARLRAAWEAALLPRSREKPRPEERQTHREREITRQHQRGSYGR